MNILVVDDERLRVDGLERLLQAEGHAVLGVYAHGERWPAEAIGHAYLHSFDVAFLGLVMPVMDGLELAGHIKRLAPGIFIVLISTAFNDGIPEFVLEANVAGDFVPLPFDAILLREVLAGAEKRARARLAEITDEVIPF